MLQIGQRAPDFALPDADMEEVQLSSFLGRQHVVLFFYPKDNTPGCTLQATDFSDHEDDFGRCGCVVMGLSRDDCLSHADFRDEHGISVRLLSDADGEVCERFGVLQEREVDGVRRRGIVRSTFVIDREGIVRQVYSAVTPKGHAMEVLRFVKNLAS